MKAGNISKDKLEEGGMPVGVNFFGPIHTQDGIGEAARLMLLAFKNAGIKVAVNPLSRPVAKEENITNINNFNAPYGINYFHFSSRWVEYYLNIIDKDIMKEKYNIAYWFTEVKEYPDEWAKNYKYFDEIWTASSFCQDSISMKVPIPTILIPLPIVGEGVQQIKMDYTKDNCKFTFLVMANMYSDIERKNVLQSLEAFSLSFPSQDDVCLIVKISNPNVDESYMEKIKSHMSTDKRIILLDNFMSRDEVNDLFQSVDVYVSLHRAEGFGLTLAEAMYHGIPVITTAYSGNMDFCNSFNSYLVDYDLVQINEDRLRYRKNDLWAAPKLESAIEMFQKVYSSNKDVKYKTKCAKDFIEANFSMNVISDKIVKRINMIQAKFEFHGSFGEYQ